MNNQHSILISIAICSGLLLGCSNDDNPYSQQTASIAPPTGIPDQNSFTLSKSKITVEGLNSNVNNSENTITAYVADRHNHAVPDDTVINFLTDSGALITRACITVAGACSVIWRSQDPKPADGQTIVIAYTSGEESFLDLNDNDKFDVGETITDLGEPFLDTNKNTTHDAATEEFVDRNGNKVYDGPDGMYTGEQCVGDNTVCNRTQLLVWSSAQFGVAQSFPSLVNSGYTVFSDTTAAVDTTAFIDIQIVDLNGTPMADGATIGIEASDGTLATATFTAGAGRTTYFTTFETPSMAGNVTFTVTVTQPETSNVSTFSLIFIVL